MPFDKTKRKENFLNKAKNKYGDQYDYSRVEYKNKNTHVEIVCPVHGVFYSSPKNFLSSIKKIGCPKCSLEVRFKLKIKDLKSVEVKKCGTERFNVKGGTKLHHNLLLAVFAPN